MGPCLFGTLGLVFLMPPNIIGGKYVEKLQDQQLQEKDLRIKVYATLIKTRLKSLSVPDHVWWN